MLVDQSQVALGNEQINFGDHFVSDQTSGGANIGIDIEDVGSVVPYLWLSGAVNSATTCVKVGAGSAYQVVMVGAHIVNCDVGIQNDSDVSVIAANGTYFDHNPVAAVNNSATNKKFSITGAKVNFGPNTFTGLIALQQVNAGGGVSSAALANATWAAAAANTAIVGAGTTVGRGWR